MSACVFARADRREVRRTDGGEGGRGKEDRKGHGTIVHKNHDRPAPTHTPHIGTWIQIPSLLIFFYNGAKRSEIGHLRSGIGLRISGRTFSHSYCTFPII
jgi:hypothetical protein